MNGFEHKESVGLLGGLEAGGTKFNCVVGSELTDAYERASFPTTTPAETLKNVQQFFLEAIDKYGELEAIGVASFGPVELCKTSDKYGSILSTPKVGWSNTNIVKFFSDNFSIPIGFDTDVNGAAIGEHLHGAAQQAENFVYVTVGTGIGGGVMMNGAIMRDDAHPEIGHMLIPHDYQRDPFEGNCPFHGDCLEGLASGPAINRRWGMEGKDLSDKHQVWELQAYYLAVMCVNLYNFYSPEKIILGGGVMKQSHLFPLVRQEFLRLMNGYFPEGAFQSIDNFIVPPGLDGRSGEVGSMALARDALKS